MRPAHPIIAAVSMLLVTAACGGKGAINEARRSMYDTDFAVVYGTVLDVTRELYPELDEDPSKGKIATAWHQVQYSNTGVEDPKAIRTQDRALGYDPTQSSGDSRLTSPNSLAYKRYFIRFDVSISGGRPFRIRVVGHASEWEPGNAVPSELRGAAIPHWLPGRTEALTIAIHNSLKQYAIRAPEADEAPTLDAEPAVDVTAYGPIPEKAGQLLGDVRKAINRRDITELRAYMAEDLVWSLGGSPGVDAALVMWQADPAILQSMAAAIDAGCRGDGKEVVCPPAATEAPGYTGWRLTANEREAGWQVTSFVQGD